MGEEGAVLFFKGRAGTFTVQGDTWVSLKSKEVSIQTLPQVGPCLFTHHSSDNLDINQYVLTPKIKAKSTESAVIIAWIFKAGRLHEKQMAKPNIIAVRFACPKLAMQFKDAYETAFVEWNSSDWACSVCTSRNNSNVVTCGVCKTARPVSHKNSIISTSTDIDSEQKINLLNSPQSVTTEEDVLPISEIDKWNCHWCSFLNSRHTNICIMCGRTQQNTKQNCWKCNLCTFDNPMTNEKCDVCDADRQTTADGMKKIIQRHKRASLSFEVESSSKLQQAANYILLKHPDGILCFKTLQTICEKLYTRIEKYRVLWVHHTAVQNKLLSFDGAMEFLRLLGFNLDEGQEKYVCKLEDPKKQLLDEALKIIKKVIERLDRPKGSVKIKTSKIERSSLIDKRLLKTESNRSYSETSMDLLPPCSRLDSELSEPPPVDDDFKSTINNKQLSNWSSTPGFSTVKAIKDLGDGMESDIDEWLDQEEQKEDEELTSLTNLVYWLTKERDDEGSDVLLLVHKTFSSSEKLLEVLIERFDKDNSNKAETSEINKIRRHVMQFCLLWVSNYPKDFELQSPVYDGFQWFLEQAIAENQCRKMATRALDHLKWNAENKEEEEDLPSLIDISSGNSQRFLKRASFSRNEWTVTGFTAREIAELTTLLDYEKFKQIDHRELLNQAWKKKDGNLRSPNVLEMIARCNRVTKWTQIAILHARGLEQRQKTLAWFIKLAKHLIKIKNYNSAWAVNNALNSTPIYKLDHTWSGISGKQKDYFDYQSKLFKASANYRLLRKEMETLQPPAIPQMGVLLKDLVFIDDGFLLKGTETGYDINFQKCRKLAERIGKGFGRFQKQPFEFRKNDLVLTWLTSTQDKITEIKSSFIEHLHDLAKTSDAKEKSKRFWS